MEVKRLSVNIDAVENGRWVASDELPDLEDSRIKVRGIGCTAWKAAFAKKLAALPRSERRSGGLALATTERLTTECLIEVALLDWEGMTLGEAPLPIDQIKTMLADPQYAPLRILALSAAQIVGETTMEDVADAAKNSLEA